MSSLPLVSADGRPRNRLLALLSDEGFEHIRPHLRIVPLALKQVLHKQGDPLEHVYFPTGGHVSTVSLLPEGAMVEVAMIGSEGVVGIEAFLSDEPTSATETIVQVPAAGASAARLGFREFRRTLDACPSLHRHVARFVELLYGVTGRLMACNAHHAVEKRCARSLLTVRDRMENDEFHLSHEFMAAMLGVRRQTVSEVASRLRTAGLIRYVHGRVAILDSPGLESAACDCYAVIRNLYPGGTIVSASLLHLPVTGQFSGARSGQNGCERSILRHLRVPDRVERAPTQREFMSEVLTMARTRKTAATSRAVDKAANNGGAAAGNGDDVARRAYDLYLARGREDGHDVEDWLQAERDLAKARAERAPQRAAAGRSTESM